MSKKITEVKDPDKPEKKDDKLIQEEKSATGQVYFKNKLYFKNIVGSTVILLI